MRDMSPKGTRSILDEAVRLLWRVFKRSYDGHDPDLDSDIDAFLEEWPLDEQPHDFEGYITTVDASWPEDVQ